MGEFDLEKQLFALRSRCALAYGSAEVICSLAFPGLTPWAKLCCASGACSSMIESLVAAFAFVKA
jgi:hypothetical protein